VIRAASVSCGLETVSEKESDMTTADQPETKESSVPHRSPELDQFVDKFLAIVCDTSRRYILELLSQPGKNGDTALPEKRSGDIARAIGLSPATTSEHLRQLASIGLVNSRRDGNVVYYRLCNQQLVKAFHHLLLALDEEYARRLHSHPEAANK
jgi:DNA-binding transcriptional ArsR family regulator